MLRSVRDYITQWGALNDEFGNPNMDEAYYDQYHMKQNVTVEVLRRMWAHIAILRIVMKTLHMLPVLIWDFNGSVEHYSSHWDMRVEMWPALIRLGLRCWQ